MNIILKVAGKITVVVANSSDHHSQEFHLPLSPPTGQNSFLLVVKISQFFLSQGKLCSQVRTANFTVFHISLLNLKHLIYKLVSGQVMLSNMSSIKETKIL